MKTKPNFHVPLLIFGLLFVGTYSVRLQKLKQSASIQLFKTKLQMLPLIIGLSRQSIQVANGSFDPSMDLDTQDRPHITYADWNDEELYDLKWAWFDGSIWNYETITTNVNIFPSSVKLFTISGTSWPRVSFASGDPSLHLRYASRSAGGWSVQLIQEYAGVSNSLALTSGGFPRDRLQWKFGRVDVWLF